MHFGDCRIRDERPEKHSLDPRYQKRIVGKEGNKGGVKQQKLNGNQNITYCLLLPENKFLLGATELSTKTLGRLPNNFS